MSSAASACGGLAVTLAATVGGGCAAAAPAASDGRFVIVDHGNFGAEDVQRVRRQLEIGAAALERYTPARPRIEPIVVNLRPGGGVSHSSGGQGAIELYWVRERRAPIVHELTHVLAGYTSANGHWTQEGFASYMQDRYGEDRAFPTRGLAHALVAVLRAEGRLHPMLVVMRDRARRGVFSLGSPWDRWVAYTQATSFCTYLIERYGREKFFALYDRPFESMDFPGLYGLPATALVDEWLARVTEAPGDLAAARALYHDMLRGPEMQRGPRGPR